ncbi:MAG: sensor domain-containing diguanylate cyclase [Dehalococcoidia bacterium]
MNYDALATDEDRVNARALTRRGTKGSIPALAVIIAIASFGGGAIAAATLSTTNVLLVALAAGLGGAAVGLPFLAVVAYVTKTRGNAMSVETIVRERIMATEARRREFETRLSRALEMSDEEPVAFDVIERAMHAVVPNQPSELLLADNSHAHLDRVVISAPDGEMHGCRVTSPDECVAARRAQTQVFADSEELDACPLLRGRPNGQCSAVCVPVSIMGRTVGVLHSVGAPHAPLEAQQVSELQTLANQTGNRLGMLRVMAETHVQAATDGLTGLINRRTLENRLRHFANEGIDFTFVMADLDHFKSLNDTHGHETGDRALRMFAETVRHELRAEDLACRYGGEEFAFVLPSAETHDAIEVVERIRLGLAHATNRGDAPQFTASFGIAHSRDGGDLKEVIEKADQALFAAKDAGRDRTCLDGHATPIAPTLTALG